MKLELLLFSIPKMKFDVTERIYGIHNMAGNTINKAKLQHLHKMVMEKQMKIKLFFFFIFLILLFLCFPVVKQGHKMIDTLLNE